MSNLISSIVVLILCALAAVFFLKMLRQDDRKTTEKKSQGTKLMPALELQQLESVDVFNDQFRVIGTVEIAPPPSFGITVGRPGGDADVQLPKSTAVSDTVSSVHFRLLQDEEGYYLLDEDSTNGIQILSNGTEQKVDALSIEKGGTVFFAGRQPLRIIPASGILRASVPDRTKRTKQDTVRRPAAISESKKTRSRAAGARPPFRGGDFT